MSRKKIKQVDAIRQKTLENVIEEFLRHCRLKNLSPRTLEYYEEDLSYFQRSVPVESVREVTQEVMEDFMATMAKPFSRASSHSLRMAPVSANVFKLVWSINTANSCLFIAHSSIQWIRLASKRSSCGRLSAG